jgi:hypothetical protein
MPENINDRWMARRRLVKIAASAVTTFYLYCVLILMSGTASSQWADHETEAILQYFIFKKSKIGDTGNFKKKNTPLLQKPSKDIPGLGSK